MCNKAVDISPSAMYFVPECFKTQEMCVKADDTFPFVFGSFTYQYKTQKMYDKAVSNNPFRRKYCLSWYNT